MYGNTESRGGGGVCAQVCSGQGGEKTCYKVHLCHKFFKVSEASFNTWGRTATELGIKSRDQLFSP